MFALLLTLLATLRSALRTRAELALENLALRQQLAALRRSTPRVRLRRADHAFRIGLSRICHPEQTHSPTPPSGRPVLDLSQRPRHLISEASARPRGSRPRI